MRRMGKNGIGCIAGDGVGIERRDWSPRFAINFFGRVRFNLGRENAVLEKLTSDSRIHTSTDGPLSDRGLRSRSVVNKKIRASIPVFIHKPPQGREDGQDFAPNGFMAVRSLDCQRQPFFLPFQAVGVGRHVTMLQQIILNDAHGFGDEVEDSVTGDMAINYDADGDLTVLSVPATGAGMSRIYPWCKDRSISLFRRSVSSSADTTKPDLAIVIVKDTDHGTPETIEPMHEPPHRREDRQHLAPGVTMTVYVPNMDSHIVYCVYKTGWGGNLHIAKMDEVVLYGTGGFGHEEQDRISGETEAYSYS